ncbi:hypothetical protein FDB42_11990 [Clostridium botulinum]|nr:hypothetical protein [Clostridium botulinum]
MANKEVKEFYKLANEKFEGNFKYTPRKTMQDFIGVIKNYFNSTITNDNKIKYDNQLVHIKDLEKEFKVKLEMFVDVEYLNDYSSLKTALTLLATIFISTFIGSQKVSYSDDEFIKVVVVALIIGITFYVIFMIITFIEKGSRRNIAYLKTFYSLCLKILKDIN